MASGYFVNMQWDMLYYSFMTSEIYIQIWRLSNGRILLFDRLYLKRDICAWHMCILTRKGPSIGPPAFFKQTHTHKHSVRWNGWVIGSLCLQCCVLVRPVMAPFAVCSNGVNGISSLTLCRFSPFGSGVNR